MRADISVQQIEIFLTVAKYRNISKAARVLFLSQPAVSKWLRDLEETLGKELFIRDNRGVTLSREGEILYAELDMVYHRFRFMLDRIVSDSMNPAPDTLNIGCLHEPTVMKAMFAFLGAYNRSFPKIRTPNELYSFQELREQL
ncbi:MAG: LysR family transcriptional regulator, partial [Clostridiales Family XIII bacterium]|nr:LysR family transcriptional regulator [Clostridiales Family XIII bacterium]